MSHTLMPWVRLDEEFPDHPKVVTAGPLAGWLHVCALAYCNRHLTDGFVPHPQVARLVNFAGIIDLDEDPGPMDARDLPDVSPYDLAERLVGLGMWEKRQGGYIIHDFLDYQPSRAEIEAQRKVKKDAGRAGGLRSGESRRSRTEANGNQTTKQTGSRTEAVQQPKREARGQAKPKPDPDPDPLVNNSSSNHDGVAEPVSKGEEELLQKPSPTDEPQPGAVDVIASRQLVQRKAKKNLGPIGDQIAWLTKARANVVTEHGAAIQQFEGEGMTAIEIADRILPLPGSQYAKAEDYRPAYIEDDVIEVDGRLVATRRVG